MTSRLDRLCTNVVRSTARERETSVLFTRFCFFERGPDQLYRPPQNSKRCTPSNIDIFKECNRLSSAGNGMEILRHMGVLGTEIETRESMAYVLPGTN